MKRGTKKYLRAVRTAFPIYRKSEKCFAEIWLFRLNALKP